VESAASNTARMSAQATLAALDSSAGIMDGQLPVLHFQHPLIQSGPLATAAEVTQQTTRTGGAWCSGGCNLPCKGSNRWDLWDHDVLTQGVRTDTTVATTGQSGVGHSQASRHTGATSSATSHGQCRVWRAVRSCHVSEADANAGVLETKLGSLVSEMGVRYANKKGFFCMWKEFLS
jgi:hypothetical protein